MMIKKNMSHLLVSAVMQILTGIVSVMISRSWWQIAAEPPQILLTAAWRQLQCDEITDKFSISTHFSISALHYLFILSDSRPLGWQPEIKKICIFIIWNDILCDNSYHRSVMKYWKSYEAFSFLISYLFCEYEDEDWILNKFCCKYFSDIYVSLQSISFDNLFGHKLLEFQDVFPPVHLHPSNSFSFDTQILRIRLSTNSVDSVIRFYSWVPHSIHVMCSKYWAGLLEHKHDTNSEQIQTLLMMMQGVRYVWDVVQISK